MILTEEGRKQKILGPRKETLIRKGNELHEKCGVDVFILITNKDGAWHYRSNPNYFSEWCDNGWEGKGPEDFVTLSDHKKGSHTLLNHNFEDSNNDDLHLIQAFNAQGLPEQNLSTFGPTQHPGTALSGKTHPTENEAELSDDGWSSRSTMTIANVLNQLREGSMELDEGHRGPELRIHGGETEKYNERSASSNGPRRNSSSVGMQQKRITRNVTRRMREQEKGQRRNKYGFLTSA
ncbi:hypothetical protein G7Y89_g2719 [Cudoniella acicularis]|uniref:MADS-box domain-containing protein n=1 Tax=Cudoniella acicularis TaxID=354080 RepID=A0A8H4W8D2_9HELO|nr:hypothetical protein G7Y89_g2719 [Cudoniella acicularis]